jgi:hypothetical protein
MACFQNPERGRPRPQQRSPIPNLTVFILTFVCAVCLLAKSALAQCPVTVSITNSPGVAIPDDFAGLSFETGQQLPNMNGAPGNLFNLTNTQLITLFRNLNLRNLRVGGGTVDGMKGAQLKQADVANLFGFAQAAGLKVIYSLQLLNGEPATDASAAQHVWRNYRASLDWLAIGNEPDEPDYRYPPFGVGTDATITNYPTYHAAWRKFEAAVSSAIPGVTFAAPDTGGSTWNTNFARDEKGSGLVSLFTTHDYFGGKWQGQTAETAVSNMLSPRWVNVLYPRELRAQSQVIASGYRYRLTEVNDYLRGVTNASNAFASALWALDVLHWWAEAAGCVGVNFHNKAWLLTDTIYLNQGDQSFQINPKAYGIKTFDLGGHGNVEPVTITNPNNVNLTAYAVADTTNLYVTLINKEFGPGRRAAAASLLLHGFSEGAVEAMNLTVTDGNVEATNGITLGGVLITNHAPWREDWTRLGLTTNGQFTVTVPAASAVVLKLGRVVQRTHFF